MSKSYGKIPVDKDELPTRNRLLKKRLEILQEIVKLNKEYAKINSQLPLCMTHSSACPQVEQQLEFLTARTAVYLKDKRPMVTLNEEPNL